MSFLLVHDTNNSAGDVKQLLLQHKKVLSFKVLLTFHFIFSFYKLRRQISTCADINTNIDWLLLDFRGKYRSTYK